MKPTHTPEQTSSHQITAENAYLYSPDAQPPRAGRFRRFWAGRTKAQQVLLIVGTVTIVFSSLMIGLSFTMMNSTGKKSAQNTVATSQTTNGTSSSATTSTTGEEDQGSTNSQNDTSASTEDVSWWQSLLSKVSGKTSSSSGSSGSSNSGDGSYSTDSDSANGVGYEDDNVGYEDDTVDFSSYGSVEPVIEPTISNGGSTITFASWNTLFSNKTSVSVGAKEISKKAQIIGFQELHWTDNKHRYAILNDIMCNTCKYDGYMDPATRKSPGSKPASLAIVWDRSRFSRISAGYKNVYMENDWPSGSGGSSKWITWVKLQDIQTSQQFYVVNTHTVASIESKGKPYGSSTRQAAYTKHMDTLVSQITKLKQDNLPIFITGDFNVNYRYDARVRYKNFPYTKLAAVNVRSDYQRLNLANIASSAGSQGSGTRIIDYVWMLDSPKVASVSESISSTRYGSDHSPVFYTVTMK